MAETPNRTCVICGKRYHYCQNCGNHKEIQTWKNIYHDEACMELAKIWHEYRDLNTGMSKEKARKMMEQYPDNLAAVLQNPSKIGDEFRQIFETEIAKTVDEEQIEPEKTEEAVVEQPDIIEKPQSKKHDYKRNK